MYYLCKILAVKFQVVFFRPLHFQVAGRRGSLSISVGIAVPVFNTRQCGMWGGFAVRGLGGELTTWKRSHSDTVLFRDIRF